MRFEAAKEVHKSDEATAEERATRVAEYVAHENGLPIKEVLEVDLLSLLSRRPRPRRAVPWQRPK